MVDRVSAKDRPDQRRQQAALVRIGIPKSIAQEMDVAALPGAAERLRDRCFQSGGRVTDGRLDTHLAARDELAREVGTERLALGLADIDAQNLPAVGLMDAVRDDQGPVDDAAAVADLVDLGVEDQVGIAAPSGRVGAPGTSGARVGEHRGRRRGPSGKLEGQAGLAGASGSVEREQPLAMDDADQRGKLALAPNERRPGRPPGA